MCDLWAVDSFRSLATLVLMFLVVRAVAWAVFESFLMLELVGWIKRRRTPRDRRIGELQFELTHGVEFDVELAQGDDMTAGVPLSAADLQERSDALEAMRPGRIRAFCARAGWYFVSCSACHLFSGALLVVLLVDLIPMMVWFGLGVVGFFQVLGLVKLPSTQKPDRQPGSCGAK
jgi:hypothetical protein